MNPKPIKISKYAVRDMQSCECVEIISVALSKCLVELDKWSGGTVVLLLKCFVVQTVCFVQYCAED